MEQALQLNFVLSAQTLFSGTLTFFSSCLLSLFLAFTPPPFLSPPPAHLRFFPHLLIPPAPPLHKSLEVNQFMQLRPIPGKTTLQRVSLFIFAGFKGVQ